MLSCEERAEAQEKRRHLEDVLECLERELQEASNRCFEENRQALQEMRLVQQHLPRVSGLAEVEEQQQAMEEQGKAMEEMRKVQEIINKRSEDQQEIETVRKVAFLIRSRVDRMSITGSPDNFDRLKEELGRMLATAFDQCGHWKTRVQEASDNALVGSFALPDTASEPPECRQTLATPKARSDASSSLVAFDTPDKARQPPTVQAPASPASATARMPPQRPQKSPAKRPQRPGSTPPSSSKAQEDAPQPGQMVRDPSWGRRGLRSPCSKAREAPSQLLPSPSGRPLSGQSRGAPELRSPSSRPGTPSRLLPAPSGRPLSGQSRDASERGSRHRSLSLPSLLRSK